MFYAIMTFWVGIWISKLSNLCPCCYILLYNHINHHQHIQVCIFRIKYFVEFVKKNIPMKLGNSNWSGFEFIISSILCHFLFIFFTLCTYIIIYLLVQFASSILRILCKLCHPDEVLVILIILVFIWMKYIK